MRNPHTAQFVALPSGRVLKFFLSPFLLSFLYLHSWSQDTTKILKDKFSYDTITVRKGTWFNYKGKTYKILKDTVFVIQSYEIPAINPKSVKRSNTFYDSVYKKFSRRKFSRLLYGLAFRPPENPTPTGNSHNVKSEVPFKQYAGKVIRHIRIESLDPFG